MESLVGSSLFDEAVSLVKADGPARELATVREALAGTIQTGARLSFIIPRKTKDVTIYHEFTAWWYSKKDEDKTISEAGLARFTPRGPERRKWEKLIAGGIDRFTVPHGSNLRSFRRVVQNGQEIVLLIDTSRRSDYSRSSLK